MKFCCNVFFQRVNVYMFIRKCTYPVLDTTLFAVLHSVHSTENLRLSQDFKLH